MGQLFKHVKQRPPDGVDRLVVAVEDRPEDRVARTEVVGQRGDVALPGSLGDLAAGRLVDTPAGEQALGLPERPAPGCRWRHGASWILALVGSTSTWIGRHRVLEVGVLADGRLAVAGGRVLRVLVELGDDLVPEQLEHLEDLVVMQALDGQAEHELIHPDVGHLAICSETSSGVPHNMKPASIKLSIGVVVVRQAAA